MEPRVAEWLDPRPGPQEDVEVEGQRRHADGPVRPIRHRRRPLLVSVGPARRRHRIQRGPDEGRSQAGQQAPQRHQVRADVPRAGHDTTTRRRRHRSRRPVDARQAR